MFRTGKLALAFGILIGLAVGILFGHHLRTPTAEAREPVKAAGDRYQLHSFGTNVHFGAYVIDQQTGQVFYIDQSNQPKSLGTLGK